MQEGSRTRFGRHRSVLALVACLLAGPWPSPAAAQRNPELIRFILSERLPEARPGVVCVGVQPAGAQGVRDAVSDEIPASLRTGTIVLGLSECERYRSGARRRTTGEDALIVRIGIEGQPSVGRAAFTFRWYRDGSDTGATRCEVVWRDRGWLLGDCRLLQTGQ